MNQKPPPDSETQPAPGGVAEGDGGSRELMIRSKGAGAPLTERVSRLFYRLAWRTPFHFTSIGGKLPPRFKAIPEDRLGGNAARGTALRMGYFLFNGIRQPFEEIGYARMPLPEAYIDYIHRFGWLRDLASVANPVQGRKIAERLIGDWLDVHEPKVTMPAWRPDNVAWRFLNWAAYAPYILSSRDLIYRSRVLRNISRMARHLDRTAAKAGQGKARLTAWAGVVAASLLLPEGKGRRLVGEAELAKAIGEVIYPDGGIVSRSPLGLIELISLMTLLTACYDAREEIAPAWLGDALARAVSALLGLTHGDGGLGAWQGSAALPAEQISALVEASGVRTRPQRQARDWGYQRVSAGHSILLLDAAPPPLARESEIGCASTLALEFSHGTDRIFVNCGGGALIGASLPADLARGLRTTAAHSSLCLSDTNSTALLPGGKLGRGVNQVDLERRDQGAGARIEASHDGYDRAFGLLHRRILQVHESGLQLRGDDILQPGQGKKRKGTYPFHIRFHLGAGIETEMGAEGRSAILRLPSGSLWQFYSNEHPLLLEESLWVDEEGIPRPGWQLVIEGETGSGGTSAGWILKHMA